MNLLLLFFAIPIAVIIISIALQQLFKCPFLVAGIIFSIFLVITFLIGDLNLLVATIVYTIISFITAIITRYLIENLDTEQDCSCNNRTINSLDDYVDVKTHLSSENNYQEKQRNICKYYRN